MKFFILALLFTSTARAQITDASFFPIMGSINPGVAHFRRGGIIAIDAEKTMNKKKLNVPLGGIQDGIHTNVDVDTGTGFFAFATRPVSGEFTLKDETGKKSEKSSSTIGGERNVRTEATAKYASALLDVRYFGVSYAYSDYNYENNYTLGAIPTLQRYDERAEFNYKNLKIGTALKFGDFRLGVYYLDQKGRGHFLHQPYEQTTGVAGAWTKYPAETNNRGGGFGLGYSIKKFRTEMSFERLMVGKMKLSSSYPVPVKKPDTAVRLSLVAEARVFSWLTMGIRYRRIKGNYVDLEDIISYNLIYSYMRENDYRNEIIYNVGFGDRMGFSPSFFIMQSSVRTKEPSPIYSDGSEFKARTMSTSLGLTLSFKF